LKNEILREILPSRTNTQDKILHKILRRISCEILTDYARRNFSLLRTAKLEAQNLKHRCRKNKIRIKALRDKILSQNFRRRISRRKTRVSNFALQTPVRIFNRLNFAL